MQKKNPFVSENGVAPSATLPHLSSNFGILAEGSEAAVSPDTPKATPISTQIPTLNLTATSAPSQQPEYIRWPLGEKARLVRGAVALSTEIFSPVYTLHSLVSHRSHL